MNWKLIGHRIGGLGTIIQGFSVYFAIGTMPYDLLDATTMHKLFADCIIVGTILSALGKYFATWDTPEEIQATAIAKEIAKPGMITTIQTDKAVEYFDGEKMQKTEPGTTIIVKKDI